MIIYYSKLSIKEGIFGVECACESCTIACRQAWELVCELERGDGREGTQQVVHVSRSERE